MTKESLKSGIIIIDALLEKEQVSYKDVSSKIEETNWIKLYSWFSDNSMYNKVRIVIAGSNTLQRHNIVGLKSLKDDMQAEIKNIEA